MLVSLPTFALLVLNHCMDGDWSYKDTSLSATSSTSVQTLLNSLVDYQVEGLCEGLQDLT